MSKEKTIEVCSIHIGPINLNVEEKPRKVVFEENYGPRPDGSVGPIGVAMCDHGEAEVFLGKIKKGYWKEGVESTTETVVDESSDTGGLPDDDDSNAGKGDETVTDENSDSDDKDAETVTGENSGSDSEDSQNDGKDDAEVTGKNENSGSGDGQNDGKDEETVTDENDGSGSGDGNENEGDGVVLSEAVYKELGTANDLKPLVATCTDKPLLMTLIAIETQNKNRNTWLKPMELRITEL